MAKISTKRITKNIVISLIAQIVSLAVSFIVNLIVPKFIDEYQYGYWQTYILYVSYVGLLHFGLLDGIVLRYSQYDYEELDKQRIRSQFKVLLIITSAMAVVTSLMACIVLDKLYSQIAVFVAIGILTKNLVTYTSYTFQITNRINKYALLTIINRLVFGVVVCVLLRWAKDFYWYCIADLLGDIITIFLGSIFNKGLYFGKSLGIAESIKETRLNISSGIMLLIANWSSMLIVGGAKMIVQWRWDELLFGKVSFAFSLTNLFLTFVTAISVVLFPSLKRLDEKELPSLYKNIRNVLSPILFFAMLFYFPGCWLLQLWLPAYTESLTYLGVLLPIIIYSSKVTLLTNTYLKAYRKEKQMLVINLCTAFVGMVVFLICAYLFNSLTALLVSIVLTIMLNSVISEIFVLKTIKVKIVKDFIVEAIMTVAFIIAVYYFSLWWAALAYFCVFIIYCILNKRKLTAMLKMVCRRKL